MVSTSLLYSNINSMFQTQSKEVSPLTVIKPSSAFVNNDHDYYRSSHNNDNSTMNTDFLDVKSSKVVEDGTPWQSVMGRTKRHNSEASNADTKRSNLGLGLSNTESKAFKLSNSFEILSNENNMDKEISEKVPREERPPPIFVPDINDIRSMILGIESVISKDEYSYKCSNINKIKINTTTVDAYRKLVKHLTDLNVQFHTYQIKQDRAYRVVLKNMHFSNDPQDIKSAIESYGHKVRNITNLKSYKTKQPTSVFFVDLEPTITNKDIFQIEFLLNAKIVFEPPRKFNDIVQCKKCQRYGHTKTYCWYPSRCVKCSLNHDTSKCNKPLNNPPKCVLCNGDHPSNYKGCSVYNEIKTKSFPQLRLKAIDKSSKVSDTQPISSNTVCSTNEQNAFQSTKGAQLPNNKSSTMSYAQVAAQKNTNNEENTLCQSLTLFFNKFEKLMEQQAQQIGSLINLLTTVISKLQ